MQTQDANEFIASLDLGTSCIRLAVAKPSLNDGPINILGFIERECSARQKGVVVHFNELVDGIQNAVDEVESQCGITLTSVNVVLGNSDLNFDNITESTAVRSAEIRKADTEKLYLSAEQANCPTGFENLHILPTNFIVDKKAGIISPVGLYGQELSCIYHRVFSPENDLKNIIKAANASGLHIDSFIAEPLSAALSCITSDDKELGCLVISLGSGFTHATVFARGFPIFTKCFEIGSHHITKDLAIGLRTTQANAEKIKRGYFQDSSFTPCEIQPIINPRVTEIFQTVKSALNNLGILQLAAKGIVLTGGGSLLNGICSLAEDEFNLPCRIGFPQNIAGFIDGINTPTTTATLGTFDKTFAPNDKQNTIQYSSKKVISIASQLWDKIVAPFGA